MVQITNSSPYVAGSLADTVQCYAAYYATKGTDRNSLYNPGVLFQVLAQDAAMIRAMRAVDLNAESAKLLDVGCGDGSTFWTLLRLGFKPENLHGVDIQSELIDKARSRHPLIHFDAVDATRLPFEDGTFDLVMESMMFIHATDTQLAQRIAAEMLRVTKPGGKILISDWRYAKPRNLNYQAVTRKRINSLFDVGNRTRTQSRHRGALLPPVGRFFSTHFSSSYFVVQKLFPFLTGHVVTVLKKT
jgi:ubiquinone/menaquinone biosynthesis C-methylase UbiE